MAITDHITLQGKQVPYEIARIDVDDLLLDPKNPRIDYLLGHRFGDNPSQTDVLEALWEKDQVKALADSIFANGGVREHVIVQRLADGKMVVREGNCRTASSKKLKLQNQGDNRFDRIPAKIFDANLTEDDVAVMMANEHVAKKISWDPYSQAKSIHELHNVSGKTYDWLVANLRLSRSKVSEFLAAYDAMTAFLQVHSDPSYITRFSLFHEMVRKKGLKQRFDEDIDDFRSKFFEWVAKKRLHEPGHVRRLENILLDPDAEAALSTTGFAAGEAVLASKDPTIGSDLFANIKRATEALKNAPMAEVRELQSGDPQKTILLRNLSRALEDIATMAGVKL
ncbi:MAG: hypothetical protein E7773_15000 [Sphingomonas sp.]|uniref:hypothetical protein n=1 Tax=Sphingomonas sp. TaxID=28214 RepID=UPI0012173F30|nr:hypothetical protein [Sphingomonas sp.]THD34494.1 MAG: hypothetical protein E7773_15000 [Sphingomonas sp.]